MLLLCLHQPPNISNNNSAVVDLKDIATPTAGKSMGRQPQMENSNLFSVDFGLDSHFCQCYVNSDGFSDWFAHLQCSFIEMLVGRVSFLKGHVGEVQ